jgi:hypothetical protein
MSLKVPQRNIGDWAKELIDECTASRDGRRENIKIWRNYYQAGTETGDQARFNKCYGHVDRLASYLFSPADTRFDVELDLTDSDEDKSIAQAVARQLNKEFVSCSVDTYFSHAVNWALVKGAVIMKILWGHNGLEPWNVHPEFFGVLREDIADLDRQEAFVHTTYVTPSELRRQLTDKYHVESIMAEVENQTRPQREQDLMQDSFFHQVLIGGLNPVSTTGMSTGHGSVAIAPNVPVLAAEVARQLVRVDELWVMDRDRQDWTTIRMAYPDIVIEGKDKHENICGVAGEQPFKVVRPNESDGYFWGSSEIIQISPLQDLLNGQLRDWMRLVRLRSDPPRAMTGFSGLTTEKYRALRRPAGFISEENPQAKVQDLAPEIPQDLALSIDKTIQYFDDVAGFAPILAGQGEQGVRAGVHAQTLARNASPRMRDRALLVERQCVDVGDWCLRLMQAKKPEIYISDKREPFLLSQMNEDFMVSVDSHTSSPAFSEDNERKAFLLARAGAIDHADLLWLTHPPHENILIARARERAQQEAQLLKEHPELLTKGKRGGKR